MKILAFADLHESITCLKKIEQKIEKHKPDVIVNLGDFTVFEQNIEGVLERLAKFGIPVWILHGNHETDTVCQKLCQRYGLRFIHKQIFSLNDVVVVGHGGGGFALVDKDFERFIKANEKKLKSKKVLLLTHAPPNNTKIDYIDYLDEHVGCKSYTRFIKMHNVVVALSGHIHETEGKKGRLGKTLLANPGPEGEIFEI